MGTYKGIGVAARVARGLGNFQMHAPLLNDVGERVMITNSLEIASRAYTCHDMSKSTSRHALCSNSS